MLLKLSFKMGTDNAIVHRNSPFSRILIGEFDVMDHISITTPAGRFYYGKVVERLV